MLKRIRKEDAYSLIEILTIILLSLVPLFLSYPYRVNIFLSWEGAYRISEGQIPFRDFGMPLGYMFWAIPSLFFKIFGPQLITLIKAQVLINIISGFAFRSILKSLQVQRGIRLLTVLLYCISFSFFNFWPWYNHTVIVYQMVGLAFLFHYFFAAKQRWIFLSLSALFTFCSFFTKQDGGALALLLGLALLLYYCIHHKTFKPLLIFGLSYAVSAFALIAPFYGEGFRYWYNLGQAPHTARISVSEILNEFLISSQWIKFYLFALILLAIAYYRSGRQLLTDKRQTLFLILTLGILAEAAVLQVTSYTPPDNNIFYHAFAFAFILSFVEPFLRLDFSSLKVLLPLGFGLFLWWSSVFWRYLQRMLPESQVAAVSANGENVVNRHTYMIRPPSTEIPQSQWRTSSLKSFAKINMPGPTVDGLERIVAEARGDSSLRLLNLTELTPLAYEIGYEPERGDSIPLWHHLGVGMFNKEAEMYERRIRAGQYSLVLFEHIPTLNNFFPFRVRNTLQQYYQKTDSFPAPRRGEETQGVIEVYRRR